MLTSGLSWQFALAVSLLCVATGCSGDPQAGGTGGTGGIATTGGSSTTDETPALGGATDTGSASGGGAPLASGGSPSVDGGTGSGGEPELHGGTRISGDACSVRAPTRWPATVYVVDCIIDVESSLTIDPGATIKFRSGFYLNVRPGGVLTAVGTAELPITFTSVLDDAHGGDSDDDAAAPGKNDWGCQGECGDLNIEGDGSVLEYVQDLYGSNGVYVRAQSVQISNSIFAHHANYGMVLDDIAGVETTLLSGNAFFGNGGFPLRMAKGVFLDASNIFHDPDNPDLKNAKQCVELDTDIDQLTMLGVTELGFLFTGHRIDAGLLLAVGVTLKSQGDATYLGPYGSFTNGPSMVLTSYRDDASGGDCTGDGAIEPMAGDWQGLWVEDSASAGYAASSADIRYAANTGTMPVH